MSVVGILLLAGTGWAREDAPKQVSVRGEVSAENGVPRDSLTVELYALDLGTTQQVSVSADGEFRFDSLPAGEYRLRVTAPNGDTLHEEVIQLKEERAVLSLRIPGQESDQSAPGTTSVHELQHRVPPKAMKEIERARHDSSKGLLQESISHLQQAAKLDPDNAVVHNDLGAGYMSLHQVDKAATEFQKALQVDPYYAPASANLGVAMLNLGRCQEAEQAARLALRLDPNKTQMHFLLAVCLRQLHRGEQESLQHLQRAEGEFPRARVFAAEILARQGRLSEAAGELKQYLSSSTQIKDRAAVEALLARLQK